MKGMLYKFIITHLDSEMIFQNLNSGLFCVLPPLCLQNTIITTDFKTLK